MASASHALLCAGVALPIFVAIGMLRPTVVAVFVLLCAVALTLIWRSRSDQCDGAVGMNELAKL
jgi:uncharacterized membrane protein YphA (DoxX/SURF4 family)